MMASFMSLFTGRRDAKQTARDAIVSLREQLLMIEKKEEHLQRQIAQDLATAKANAVSNKTGTPLPSHEISLNKQIAPSHANTFLPPFLCFIVTHCRLLFGIGCRSGHCCAQAEEDARGGPR